MRKFRGFVRPTTTALCSKNSVLLQNSRQTRQRQKGISDITLLIAGAVRSNAQDCRHLIPGIAGSNPVEGMDVRLLCLLCVLCCVGSCLCDGLITGSEFYRVCVCVCVCDPATSKQGSLDPIWAAASQINNTAGRRPATGFLFLSVPRAGAKLTPTRSQHKKKTPIK